MSARICSFSAMTLCLNSGKRKELGSRYYLTMGGSCGIFACQAAKLGLKTAVVGTLADDVIGRMLLEKYRESGVITEHLRFADSYTAMSVAHCRGSDRAILTLPGCIDSIAAEDVPPVLLTQTRHLHIASFYILKKMWPGWRSVISAVKASGGNGEPGHELRSGGAMGHSGADGYPSDGGHLLPQ